MSNSDDVWDLKPTDWDDRYGWDRYYEAARNAKWRMEVYRTHLIGSGYDWWLGKIPNKQDFRIWMPGCGISLLPHWLSAVGFNVWASDFSSVAIQVQEESRRLTPDDYGLPLITINPDVERGARGRFVLVDPEAQQPGELHFFIHDFRSPVDTEPFDYIINDRALQGLSDQSMRAAARTHYSALIAGGSAFFHVLNIFESDWRNRIQNSLLAAGFTMSYKMDPEDATESAKIAEMIYGSG